MMTEVFGDGLAFEMENCIEDITQPTDVARRYRLTGERWLRIHLEAGASPAAVATFAHIERYVDRQGVLLEEQQP